MNQEEIREKARQLREQMTLDEKIGMVHGRELFRTAGVPRLGIPPLTFSDGTMGVRQDFKPDSWEVIGDGRDYATYLPSASALAATWNRELAKEVGAVLGEEARARGKDVILSPGMNIKRSPLCGRNFEYFSEDPYLTGEMAVPYVRGIQQWDVAACAKHFAANNQETERLWVDVEVEEEALRTIYLPAFRKVLTKGGCLSVMAAYNLLYGEHCCHSEYLLNKILRQEWGYEGVAVSDWGGVHSTKKAALSQLDIEMSVTNDFDRYFMAQPLKEAIERGEIPEAALDQKVERILMLMMKLHMLDGKRRSGQYNTPEHRQTALKAARESVVLLKNEDGLLPLNREQIKRLLVIGENANLAQAAGGGSAEVKALYEVTPLLGICSLLGGNVRVDYVKGYESGHGHKREEAHNWQETSLENGGGRTGKAEESQEARRRREELRREAIEAAKNPAYDQVIFIGGLTHQQDSEGNDRPDMKLPWEQDLLIQGILKERPQAVIVLTGGSPVEMESWADGAKAVVWGWYAGMEGGRALAEVLFGFTNPSGKLPETFYRSHKDCSAHCLGEFGTEKRVRYREGVFVGYRYNETFGVEPRFCFGHGLSYSRFSYGPLSIRQEGDQLLVSCLVKNDSDRRGKETVQFYAALIEPIPGRPAKELCGFTKLDLAPGEEGQAAAVLELFDQPVELQAGSSAKDIRSTGKFWG